MGVGRAARGDRRGGRDGLVVSADLAAASSARTEQRPLASSRPRLARVALLAVVFVCAACGLVYELALVALGSYLLGDTAGQASVVLSVMVFAMGIGALAAKGLQAR